jgi:hypothetical protein
MDGGYTRGAYGDPAMYVLSTTHTNNGVCQPAGRCTIIYYRLCMYVHARNLLLYLHLLRECLLARHALCLATLIQMHVCHV